MGRYYHRDIHNVEVAAIDAVDLDARVSLRLWGWKTEVTHVAVTPCERELCRGSILDGICHLCARPKVNSGTLEPEWAALLSQPEQPAGARRRRRAGVGSQ